MVDVARHRWRVGSGDTLLLTEGSGLDLTFLALVPVLQVVSERRDGEPEGEVEYVTTLSLGDAIRLPEGSTLERFMYSLRCVSNLGRPWLHMRHKARISGSDLETLKESRIAWDRSVFFGLLSRLPPPWRAVLEAESRVRSAYEASESFSSRPRPEPAKELLSLLEALLLVPAQIGADVERMWTDALGEILVNTDVMTSDGEREPWNLRMFLSVASSSAEQLAISWNAVRELPYGANLADSKVQWRPHRW